jgi:hypothetical protein
MYGWQKRLTNFFNKKDYHDFYNKNKFDTSHFLYIKNNPNGKSHSIFSQKGKDILKNMVRSRK